MERRKDIDHVSADRFTKQIIVVCVCAIAFLMAATMSYLAIVAATIPDQIDRLATLLVGALVGCLVKTGVDNVIGPKPAGTREDPIQTEATVTTTPDAPLDVQVAPEEEEIQQAPLPASLMRTRPVVTPPFEPKDEH